MFKKLGRVDALMAPHVDLVFLARSTVDLGRGKNRSMRVPFSKGLLLQTGKSNLLQKCSLYSGERSVPHGALVCIIFALMGTTYGEELTCSQLLCTVLVCYLRNECLFSGFMGNESERGTNKSREPRSGFRTI